MKLRAFLFAALSILATGCHGPERAAASSARSGPAPLAVGRGVIDAEPGVIVVAAPSDGVVRSVNVVEGDRVLEGAVLARMDDRLARLALDVSSSDIAELDARARVAATRARSAGLEASRLQRLADSDAGTRQDADQARALFEAAQGELEVARSAAYGARTRRSLDAYAVQARILTAPVAGRIVRRAVAERTTVSSGAVLFELEPQGARVVRAELDEAYADRLHPGMMATVSLESNPARTFPARVEHVSERFGGSTIAGDPTAPTDTRSLGVVLSLAGAGTETVRLGQRVLVRVAP
ncbi:HlyD family secretion protein [soil metagenome]